MRENHWIHYGRPESGTLPVNKALKSCCDQVDVHAEIAKLPELEDAHCINIVVRRDGKDEVYEADWLKQARKQA